MSADKLALDEGYYTTIIWECTNCKESPCIIIRRVLRGGDEDPPDCPWYIEGAELQKVKNHPPDS